MFLWRGRNIARCAKKKFHPVKKSKERMTKARLFGDSDDEDVKEKVEEAGGEKLSINKNYADRYNQWRQKEELQKCECLASACSE